MQLIGPIKYQDIFVEYALKPVQMFFRICSRRVVGDYMKILRKIAEPAKSKAKQLENAKKTKEVTEDKLERIEAKQDYIIELLGQCKAVTK